MLKLGRITEHTCLTQVQRPHLPDADQLRTYLDRIDKNRWYSNRGELVWELEARLSRLFGFESTKMISFASGSVALEAAILATTGWAKDERPLALLPSYTFVATAQAALGCGYRLHLVDVDPHTWMLDPAALADHPLLDQAGVILPVAAYGRSPDMRAWEWLQNQTGVPVVVDAAAAFERFTEEPDLISRTVPAVLSFHATKSFSTAEGGAVLLNDPVMLRRLGCLSNFGMDESRQCLLPGLNGKLSEYHAAVGLACLDTWAWRRSRYRQIAESYQHASADLPGRIVTSPEISSAYICYETPDSATAGKAAAALAKKGIQTRRWYGNGLHRQPFFASTKADPLPVSDDLSGRHLGLPGAIDLGVEEINLVTETLHRVMMKGVDASAGFSIKWRAKR